MRFYAGPAVLAIDELGYLPLPKEAASALFQVVSQRYLKAPSSSPPTAPSVPSGARSSTTPRSQSPSSTRLLHRCTLLQVDGQSYRMRTHRAQVEALPRSVTTLPSTAALLSQKEVVVRQSD
jgi:DNA replication protein DnaC